MNLPMASEDDRQVAQELGLLLRGTGDGNVHFSQTRYEQVSISGTTGGAGDGSAASAGASLAAQYGMRDQQGAGGGAMAGGMAGAEGFGGAPAGGGYGARDYPHRSGSAPPSVEGSIFAMGNFPGFSFNRQFLGADALGNQPGAGTDGGGGGGGGGSAAAIQLQQQQHQQQQQQQQQLQKQRDARKLLDRLQDEEALRADPGYLEYYYRNHHLNPRLPPPLISRDTYRLAQRLQSSAALGLGGEGAPKFPSGGEGAESGGGGYAQGGAGGYEIRAGLGQDGSAGTFGEDGAGMGSLRQFDDGHGLRTGRSSSSNLLFPPTTLPTHREEMESLLEDVLTSGGKDDGDGGAQGAGANPGGGGGVGAGGAGAERGEGVADRWGAAGVGSGSFAGLAYRPKSLVDLIQVS
ncbi:unnamed protein product [Closterium sp. Yama58-4]|nr:unnamed protein product [Closterium sp. Yama58-4]